jgi:hypothetical protein
VGGDFGPVFERHDAPVTTRRDGHARGRTEDLDLEADRLVAGALSQLGSADTAWETEIVLDAARLTRLAAGRRLLDEQRPQSFTTGVDRGAQPGRSCPYDDHVVEGAACGHR